MTILRRSLLSARGLMQIKMRDIAKHALDTGTALPDRYWRLDRWWITLGALAFPAVVSVIGLMVMKPT